MNTGISTGDRDQLFRELGELREDVRSLTRRIDRLYEIFESRGQALAVSSGVSASIVSSVGSSGYFGQQPADSRSVVLEEFAGGSEASTEVVPGDDWVRREAVARDIGTWLRRALQGGHRGPSGRNRIREASGYYIVCRDFFGVVSERPVRVLTNFSEVKSLCSRRGSWGESVFVGLPTLREVFAALQGGDFGAPADLNHGTA